MNAVNLKYLEIQNFLTADSSRSILGFVSKLIFVNSLSKFPEGSKLVKSIRDSSSAKIDLNILCNICDSDIKKFFNDLTERAGPDFVFSEISEIVKVYKYEIGQKFSFHKDMDEVFDTKKSIFTLLIYLNSNYSGGRTTFRKEEIFATDLIEIEPEPGKALIFRHGVWHSSSPVTEGTKYVLRLDLLG
jgi:hypothetical protein